MWKKIPRPKPENTEGEGPGVRRSLPWKRILLGSGIFLAALLFIGLGILWRLIATAPDIDSITVSPVESATYICDQEGNYTRKLTLASSNRDIVSLEEIPDSLQHAIIAIEDERFYEHGGIDLRGIARAFWTGVTSGSFSEGASTITQQLIKNNVFTEWTQENSFRDRFSRKIQEQYLALQLEDRISKEEILEDYLNTINLGSGCYGVQAAARRYFGKDVSALTLAESAVLAAIPQNPSGYNPISAPEANQRRQKIILEYMREQGYISQAEQTDALAEDVYSRIRTYNETYEEAPVYSYYEDALIDQVMELLMEERDYSYEQAYRAVYSGGLRIFSAQDFSIQQICDEEFQNPANYPEGTEYGIDYALSVADENGEVTHYGSEALRSYIRQTADENFDLLCRSQEEAQGYADLFRQHILSAGEEQDTVNNPSDGASSESDLSGAESSTSVKDSSGAETSTPVNILGERLTLSPQPQASLVLMDQSTGYVRAIVGGRGEKTASLTLNRATGTTRQPGSTFKILTAYAPALDARGETLATTYQNEPYKYADGTPVSNWDVNDYSGTVTVREAITRSINVIAVKCITDITPRLGFDYARKFGISTLVEQADTASGASSDVIQPLALGGITNGVTNLELCNAYAAIANGGLYTAPKFFTKVLNRQGEVLLDFTGETSSGDASAINEVTAGVSTAASADMSGFTRVLSGDTAFLLTDAMEDVVSSPSGTAYGTIWAAEQPVAGKTGTTSDYRDIWFVGYTPYYTCSVWGGYDNNQPLPLASTSHVYNKILWSAVMNRVNEGLPAADFPRPDSIVSVTLCRDSHLTAVEGGCPDTYTEYFTRGTEPERECGLHEAVPETETVPDLENILEELESESESETESESKTETETLPPALLPAESESMPEETLPDTQQTDTEPLLPDPAPLPEQPEQPEYKGNGQPDTSSLEDLLNRLTGAGTPY